MARPLRLEFPGAINHITSRGNARGMIFDDDRDREKFLDILASVIEAKSSRRLSRELLAMTSHKKLRLPQTKWQQDLFLALRESGSGLAMTH